MKKILKKLLIALLIPAALCHGNAIKSEKCYRLIDDEIRCLKLDEPKQFGFYDRQFKVSRGENLYYLEIIQPDFKKEHSVEILVGNEKKIVQMSPENPLAFVAIFRKDLQTKKVYLQNAWCPWHVCALHGPNTIPEFYARERHGYIFYSFFFGGSLDVSDLIFVSKRDSENEILFENFDFDEQFDDFLKVLKNPKMLNIEPLVEERNKIQENVRRNCEICFDWDQSYGLFAYFLDSRGEPRGKYYFYHAESDSWREFGENEKIVGEKWRWRDWLDKRPHKSIIEDWRSENREQERTEYKKALEIKDKDERKKFLKAMVN